MRLRTANRRRLRRDRRDAEIIDRIFREAALKAMDDLMGKLVMAPMIMHARMVGSITDYVEGLTAKVVLARSELRIEISDA